MKSKRDVLVYLEDIYESADLIESYLSDVTESLVYKSTEKQDAVLHRIQVIGEAAKHISASEQKKWVHIPWREIAGMRDIIVHEYFGITLGMIWKTAVEDIPVLKVQVKEIMDDIDGTKITQEH